MEVDCAGTSSARRRRERRLRSWLRHERMTVAMELAAATHHSSPKGGWPGATHDALRGQTTASSGGRRPGVLKEPEPPNVVERVQRHILEQTVSAPGLQILDAPVPQTVDQLVTALSHVDSFVPEQVIEVPKFSLPPCRPRTALREPQTAEQLVDVPTVVSWSVLIPVPRGSGGQRLQGSLPEQSPAARPVEQLVDIYSGGGLQGLRPGQGSTAFPGGSSQRTAAQIADIPVPGRDSRSFPPESDSHAFGEADHRVRRSPAFRGHQHHDDGGFVPGQGSTALSRDVEEEGEHRMLLLNDCVRAGLPLTSDEYAAWRRWMGLPPKVTRRKRKKRRKRRTPRTSSLPGRARRRQRQWSACNAGFTCHDAPRVIFPSGVVRPRMLCILAGMDQKDCFDVVPMVLTADTVEFPQVQFHDGRRHPFRAANAVPHGPDCSTVDTCTASVYEASFFVFWWSLVSPFSAQCLVRQLLREMTP